MEIQEAPRNITLMSLHLSLRRYGNHGAEAYGFHDENYNNVPMEGLAIRGIALDVRDNRRYPDGVKSHVLNVVELVRDAFPGAATILALGSIA